MKNNPESIVKNLIEAMADNDAKAIRSLFHNNSKQAYGEGEWKSGSDFFSWLESDIINRQGKVDESEYETNGNEVIVKGQYSSIGYTNKADFLFVIEGDKIASWQMRYLK